jgi:hypothetical protein
MHRRVGDGICDAAYIQAQYGEEQVIATGGYGFHELPSYAGTANGQRSVVIVSPTTQRIF